MPPADSGPEPEPARHGTHETEPPAGSPPPDTELPPVAPIPGATDTGATIPTPLADRPTSSTLGTGSTIALGCVAAAVIVVFVVILILTIVS
jgi:hypothetical protein